MWRRRKFPTTPRSSAAGCGWWRRWVWPTSLKITKRPFGRRDYNPASLLPSTLAALGSADAKKPTMVMKVDAHTTSIAILNEGQLQLFRTLENSRGVTITGEQLARGNLSRRSYFFKTRTS